MSILEGMKRVEVAKIDRTTYFGPLLRLQGNRFSITRIFYRADRSISDVEWLIYSVFRKLSLKQWLKEDPIILIINPVFWTTWLFFWMMLGVPELLLYYYRLWKLKKRISYL